MGGEKIPRLILVEVHYSSLLTTHVNVVVIGKPVPDANDPSELGRNAGPVPR
jgi:hypothetical protein